MYREREWRMCILMLGCKGWNDIYWIRLKDFKLRGNTWHQVLSIGATVLASQKGCLVCYLQVTDLPTTWLVEALNPLSPKIWLIILPSSYNTSCCTSTWWVWVFLSPVCRLLYGYYRENLQCTCLSLLGVIRLSLLTNKWSIKPSWTS